MLGKERITSGELRVVLGRDFLDLARGKHFEW
jgi:hypothetical protein